MERDPRELAGAWTRFQSIGRCAPAPDLAPFVERYSLVEWDYAEPYRQLMVPYPQVHLTLRSDHPAEVHGVAGGHIVRVLHGRARMLAVTFRPGGFRPFLDGPVSALTGRSVPIGDISVLPAGGPAAADPAAVDAWLRAARPAVDPVAMWAGEVVGRVAAEPAITRVDRLAEECGCTVRRLQRVFAEYVGIGPKWVIRRYRLHEVTEHMAAGRRTDWAAVAADLGYADQAHLVRDFTAMFGEPPTRYAARY
jgi:AraC-like DNA-binding protein